jgi:aryl-alcohol dehydrogenase-like predicted oxidoreductase
MMRRRPLGKTGLSVSEIGLGTWTFSGDWGPADDAASVATIERALERGVEYLDVAAAWGHGRVETLVGRAIRMRREKVVLGVRVGVDLLEGGMRLAFSPDRLESQMAASLGRLGTTDVDLVLLHGPSLDTLRRGEFLQTFDRWRAAGKMRAWGATVTSEESARAAMDAGAEVLALPYNLLHGAVLHPIAPDIEERKVGVLAHTTLEYGLLAGKWTAATRFGADDHRSRRFRPMDLRARLRKVDQLRFLTEGTVQTMAEAAVRFVLSTGIVSSAVVGVRTAGQLEEVLRAAGAEPYLDAAQLARVGEALRG